MIFYDNINTPLGNLVVGASQNQITHLWFSDSQSIDNEFNIEHEIILKLRLEMNLYFKGELKEFSIPLKPQGTDFQKRVWKELIHIPYGQTCSYKELAIRLGDKKLTRAVANANSKNPILILIPCHRVIGDSGKLTGYSGGIEKKSGLLNLESNQSTLF